MTQLAHDHENSATRAKPRRLGVLLAAGLLMAAGALYVSMPAYADSDSGNGGGETRGDSSASDHDGIYEAQRGEAACDPGVTCGAPEATPAHLPPSQKRR